MHTPSEAFKVAKRLQQLENMTRVAELDIPEKGLLAIPWPALHLPMDEQHHNDDAIASRVFKPTAPQQGSASC